MNLDLTTSKTNTITKMTPEKDAFGKAILDFAKTGIDKEIIVKSDLCDDDVIPTAYLFRGFEEMPEIEQVALKNCKGKTLDIGAGAGMHALWLKENGLDVSAIDVSSGAVEYMQQIGLETRQMNFYSLQNESYDTLLFLMNGIGIAGTLSNLKATLLHAKSLLNTSGQLIFDSSDIKYLYENEDGSMWMDLASEYYGNFNFQMEFEGTQTDWFPWLYVDQSALSKVVEEVNGKMEILFENDSQFLVRITF